MRWWRRQGGQTDAQPDALAARDELLSAFLDGELDPAEARSLSSELTTDPELRAALEGMREIKSALGSLGEVRAPRSFALAAPPVPARRGLGRVELGARVGAVAAAVAFVAVIGSDLRGSTSDPVAMERVTSSVQQYDSRGGRGTGESTNESAAGAAESAPGAPSSVAGAIPTSISEPAESDAAAPEATDVDGTPTTLLAPQTDVGGGGSSGSTGSAPADTGPASTEDTFEQRLNDPDANVAPPEGGASSSGDTPAVAPRASDAPLRDPVAASQPPAVAPGSFGSAPVGRGGDASSARIPELTPEPDLSTEWRVTVKRSSELDATLAAEIGLGSLAVVLGGGAGWLWYRRRRAASTD